MSQQFERGQLTAPDFLNAYDMGVREFFLAIKDGGRPDSIMEFYVEDKKQIRLNSKSPGDSAIYFARWDDKAGKYIKDGSYLRFDDVNLVPTEGCPNYIFRRYDRARECAGLEFTGEGKAPPAPSKKVSTKKPQNAAAGIQIIDMTQLMSRLFGMPSNPIQPSAPTDSVPPATLSFPNLDAIMRQMRAARKPDSPDGNEKPTA